MKKHNTCHEPLGSQWCRGWGWASRSVAASARLRVPRMLSTRERLGRSRQMIYGTSPVQRSLSTVLGVACMLCVHSTADLS